MYKEFRTEKEINAWLNKNYYEFLNKTYNDSNKNGTLGEAIFSYTGSMSTRYNDILKDTNGDINRVNEISNLSKDQKDDINFLYNAFDYNVIPENIYLYHYFNKRELKLHIKKNAICQLNMFISTTCIKNNAGIRELIKENKYNSVFKIAVKKGTPCIPVGNNPNSLLKEYEVILKPQSKLRIIKVKWYLFSKIRREIECELS